MIGMPTGEASGVWALDVDNPELFEANCKIELPRTRKVETGKGYHLYFAHDPAHPIRNAQQHPKTGWPFPSLPGAETRGEGGYVILPPSRHPSGRHYAWAVECESAPAPTELLRIVTEKRTRKTAAAPSSTTAPNLSAQVCNIGDGTPYGLAALADECASIRRAGNGEQEPALNEAALKIGALVAGRELLHHPSRSALISAGCAMPSYNPDDCWTPEKIIAKVDRGMADGAVNPRTAPRANPDVFDPETGELCSASAASARRGEQRKVNVDIGEGSDTIPTARVCSLDQMLDDCVFIRDGSQVAQLDRPQAALALADFKNAMAGSKHAVDGDGGKVKMIPTVKAWLEHRDRKEAETLTFRAGAPAMTSEPETGRQALNLWKAINRPASPSDWQDRARPFLDHINWLWGEDAGAFLNWLAHIEQRPGELPHYGWVHISREHGKGRNWISSVLVRLWRGHTAASLDLLAILDGGFNGRMSRKLLAIVDEINEGGNSSYRHAQTLRQIVTAEHREINPKYGRQRVEWNSCRWLMFSNHTGAIPLGEDDRRFWIVSHAGEPKKSNYYTALYQALADPLFIASVAEFLRQRELSGFKPGARPPMNAAKADLVAFGQTEDEVTLAEIVKRWPVDIITAYELNGLLEDGGPSRPAVRHAMDRAGIRKIDHRVRVDGQGSQRCHAVRNFAKWRAAEYDELKAEISRVKDLDSKRTAIGRGIEA